MGSNCTVISAATTGVDLGSGTNARPPPLGPRWEDTWVPRKLEFKGSRKHLHGIEDDQVNFVLDEHEVMLPKEAKELIDWVQSRDNQGTRPRKPVGSTWHSL